MSMCVYVYVYVRMCGCRYGCAYGCVCRFYLKRHNSKDGNGNMEIRNLQMRNAKWKEEWNQYTNEEGASAPAGYENMQQQKLNFKIPPIQSFGEILARLAAKDGFTINGITKSEFICDSFSAKGYKLPMCVNNVMNLILKYYEDKEKEIVKELSDICSSVYIPGKCGAVEVRQIVEERLKYFGVKFESDVVAVADGPNSEVIVARNALHNDDKHSSSDETSGTDTGDESYIFNEEPRPQIIDYKNNVMTETRSIIKFFRKSPLKSITLQKHVVAEFGVELVLLLDVKTRWNSMLTMIEQFLKLKNAIKKALIDLASSQKWNEDNITVLQKLQMISTPKKLRSRGVEMFWVKDKGSTIPLYSVHGHPLEPRELAVAGRDRFVRIYDRRKSNKPINMYCPSFFHETV
ncbi:hypothetical protein EVAR_91216_1, partial [Eumeta japonica]